MSIFISFVGFVALMTVTIVSGCAPSGGSGTGSSDLPDYAYTANPVFRVQYAPAVGWTYPISGAAATGQAATATSATAASQKAFKTALSDALVKSGVASTTSHEINVDEVVGQQINVATSLANAAVGTGIVSGGTVLETCTSGSDSGSSGTATENPDIEGSGAGSGTCTDTSDNILDHSIAIINGPTLTGAQWRSVARSLQVALLLNNAFLANDIIVTQDN